LIEIKTGKRVEVIDITSKVKEEVKNSGVSDGMVIVYTKHTTTAITVNENESGLKEDMLNILERVIPTGAGYEHDRIDNNADAHLRAILIGNSITVPVSGGNLDLGTWQSILFVELDGPRKRKIGMKVIKS